MRIWASTRTPIPGVRVGVSTHVRTSNDPIHWHPITVLMVIGCLVALVVGIITGNGTLGAIGLFFGPIVTGIVVGIHSVIVNERNKTR